MTIESAIIKNVENLPESVKQSVLLYTQFLASQYAESKSDREENIPRKRPLAGSMKGTFVLPLPENFDEPIEDFEEYM